MLNNLLNFLYGEKVCKALSVVEILLAFKTVIIYWDFWA